MDVARFLIRTRCAIMLNETFNIKINEETCRIKMTEDSYDPMRISLKLLGKKKHFSDTTSESDSKWSNQNWDVDWLSKKSSRNSAKGVEEGFLPKEDDEVIQMVNPEKELKKGVRISGLYGSKARYL